MTRADDKDQALIRAMLKRLGHTVTLKRWVEAAEQGRLLSLELYRLRRLVIEARKKEAERQAERLAEASHERKLVLWQAVIVEGQTAASVARQAGITPTRVRSCIHDVARHKGVPWDLMWSTKKLREWQRLEGVAGNVARRIAQELAR